MPSVGAQLTQARTERRLSLQEATKATKIQVWVLEALERDELHATMSPVYVKGFLSTYAKFLGLEPAPLIAQLLPAPTGSGQPTPEASPHSTPLGFIDRFEWGGPWARRIGSLGLGLAGLLVVMNTHPQRWVPRRVAHQEASLSVIHKQEPLAPQPSIALKPLQPLELAIVARQPTWISVKADGTLVAQQKLAAGAQEAWKADRRFDVVIGAPAKVEVLLNGRSISPLAMAHRGRLAITHSGIAALKEEAPAPRPARVGSAR
ncbi:MAG: helix-turn-helix domain-containing protein [Candidatus Omnitrophica bacterium]|nr:helix-turn-helix domain-containing protein [Candidatus Omnitrophota bacterium]